MRSFPRSSRRPVPIRPLVLGCALFFAVGLDACATDQLHPNNDGGPPPNRWTGTLYPGQRDVDVVFVIDDSSGMAAAQNNLISNFPTFMTALQADPAGLPNLQIAVVSTDFGAGDGSIAGCDYMGGKNGVFQYAARGTCSASNLQRGATFISNVGGGNYTGNIADVFGCIAALGESGCGFQQPLAAVLRAFGADGRDPPQENQSFLRPEAVLAIVMLTPQDDCSAAPGNGPNAQVPLFDTSANHDMASQLGPPTHFRCNEFGHTCPRGMLGPNRNVPHPDRTAPNNDVNQTVTYDNCASDDTEGYLLSTKQAADAIKSLKADPNRIVVTSIQGPPTPYTVHWNAPAYDDASCGAASCPWPAITHACTAADGRVGDPGVRNAQLAEEFGINGLQLSVCDASFGPGLARFAAAINQTLGPPCVQGPVGLNSSGQPDCKVTEMQPDGAGHIISSHVPSCADSANLAPCWQLETSATCPDQILQVSPDPNIPSSIPVTVTYDCAKLTFERG